MRLLPSIALGLCAWSSSPLAAFPEAEGRVSAALSESTASWLISLDRRARGEESGGEGNAEKSSLGFRLDAGPEGSALSGRLELSGPRARLAAGPGSASGSLRFLCDPLSPSSLEPGPPLELDSSLESRRAMACLDAGPLSLYAIGGGEGEFALGDWPRDRASVRGLPRPAGPAAGGAALRFGAGVLRLEAIGAASIGTAAAEPEGWAYDPASSKALLPDEGERPIAAFALLASSEGEGGGALAAWALSEGRLSGAGLAARLEAWRVLGTARIGLKAAAIGPRYRAPLDARRGGVALGESEIRLALRRSASLSISARAEAGWLGPSYAPPWRGGGSLALRLPVGGLPGRRAEARLEAGPAEGSFALGLLRDEKSRGGEASSRLGARLGWAAREAGGRRAASLDGLELSLAARVAGGGGLPALELELSLDLLEGGDPSSPVLAKGALGLALPFGEGGRLAIEAGLPEAGLALAPQGSGPASAAAGVRPLLSATYSAYFGSAASRRRPRSRISGRSKARSIA
jgi:hypothetical protein